MHDPQADPPDAPSLLQARGLTRRAGAHTLVRGIDLTLRRGEVVGLLGPNGAGKSTTLRMLAGVLRPDAGVVRIEDRVLDRAARRRIGYLPEEPPLYPELTVDEQLRLAGRLRGLRAGARARAVAQVKDRCGLRTVERRLVGRLSKGYRQRVGLAQALLGDPPVVLLDEPTVGLDPVQLREVRELVQGLRSGHAVLFSTHILPEAQAVCDRVLILVAGRIVHEARLTEEAPGLRYRLAFATDPGVDALAAVPGVTRVDPTRGPAHAYTVQLRDEGVLDRLLDRATTAGWGLRALEPERRSLETLFMDYAFGAEARAA